MSWVCPRECIVCVQRQKQVHGHECVAWRGVAGCASAFRFDLPFVAAKTIIIWYWVYVAQKPKLCKCRVCAICNAWTAYTHFNIKERSRVSVQNKNKKRIRSVSDPAVPGHSLCRRLQTEIEKLRKYVKAYCEDTTF